MTNETAPPPNPAGPQRPAPAIPFTNGQLNALSDRRARAIVEMLMPKANRALKLQGKRVVIVANLEPRVIRGIRSAGMLLATGEGERVVLVELSPAVPPGAKVK